MTDIYALSQSTGSQISMTGSTQIFAPSASYSSTTSLYSIGFTFYFDKVAYTTFSVNTSGLMSLGRTTYQYPYSYYWPNVSTLSSYYPLIAGYWLYYGAPKATTGKVHYKLTGTAPNRVLVVEWLDVYSFNGTSTSYPGGTWQVRLYEGSNRIEYWYGAMAGTTNYYATIGIAASSTRYINVYGNDISQYYLYPSGQYYTYRYINSYPMTVNRTFDFAPCDKTLDTILGNVAQGGSSEMKSGDQLFVGKQVMRGNTQGFQPFSFDLPPSPCSKWTYTISFSGAAASDYSVSPGNGTVITDGMKPTINFTPGGVGERTATMTLSVSNGQTYAYTLKAEGVTRVGYAGNVTQGGSVSMSDGDVLLTNIDVNRNTKSTLTPFALTNINAKPTAPGLANVSVKLVLDDPHNQYQLGFERSGTTAWAVNSTLETIGSTLTPGESGNVKIIMFPTPEGDQRGTGYQEAYLAVTVDGETRNFIIRGYSVAPVLDVYFEQERLNESSRRLFVGEVGCVGESAIGGTFKVRNGNKVPVVINSFDILTTDNEVKPGAPPYKQRLDANGKLIPMVDYFLSTNGLNAPASANTLVQFPLTIMPGEERVYQLGFVAQRPEKRYGRIFIQSDAVNFVGRDVDAYMPGANTNDFAEEEGILPIDVFGRGIGSHLASDPNGNLKNLAMIFPSAKVDESSTTEIMVYNTGDCDMRISQKDLRIVAGDINDFELIEVLPNTPVDANGDFIIPSGGSGRISARFTPNRSGSRRASVMLRTNDSTVVVEGMTDRGIHTLDLYGVGKAYLEIKPVKIAPAVIGSDPSRGIVKAINASTESVTITSATISGADAAEFTADPSKPWPTFPMVVRPGESVDFSLLFQPGTRTGTRNITFSLTTNGGDVLTVPVTSLAGTRMIEVTPNKLFQGTPAAIGSFVRQYAIVTNVGTFPVRLSGITLSGSGAGDYKVNTSPNMDLDPGASKFIEVVYFPTISGTATAQIEIASNATAGSSFIELFGTASVTALGDESGGSSISANQQSIGAGRTTVISELAFEDISPNPARDVVTISFTVPVVGATELTLFDASGRMVKEIVQKEFDRGIYSVNVDLTDFSTGIYHCLLRSGNQVVTKVIQVVE
ncbi:MAG: choice-of-anchor D domain-containing protein [Ignavibacteriae bacterium]|nr:choice-of-anchor D domain-containing protein [Ignavibacteriota bacterium]MCB9216529.1 choice-of-anchor D domain-containing protein [Ignavibacteria bacterium]